MEAFIMRCAELFINFLKSKNFNFNANVDSDGDYIVDFPYDGKITKCIFSGDDGKYLSLYLIYENIPEDKLASLIFACNELNTRYKWVTFYVDTDRDLMLHDDAILTPENAADEAFEILLRMINIGNEAKPTIMRALYV
jgi:hypothetical protein